MVKHLSFFSPLWAVIFLSVAGAVNLGGFYTDPNHFKSGSFAGTRMISDESGDTPSDRITLIGSDDGLKFWTLYGSWTDKAALKINVDFSPKGGPANFNGTVVPQGISWQDGNHWTRLGVPTFSTADDMSEGVFGGFFTDPNHAKPGSFAGTRLISEEVGDIPGTKLTLVGSDDGFSFWSLTGTWTDRASGKLTVDFSPKGGPSGLTGSYSSGHITWQDGNHWSRQAMKADAAFAAQI
jgi:hypothetical protein